MSRISMALTALAMACLAAGSQAQVMRCVDAAGKVSYTDQPCAQAQQSREVKTYASPPVQASAPASAAVPKLSAEALAHEQKRQQKREQSNANQQHIDEASAKVRQIRSDNADPVKCAEAKRRMALIQKRDPVSYYGNLDYYEFQHMASLYCGN